MLFEVVLNVERWNRWMLRGHGLLSESADDMDEGVCAEPDEWEQDERSSEGLSRHG
jgi:hypothetical protein